MHAWNVTFKLFFSVMKALDILITTAGAWPYPFYCIETLLGGVRKSRESIDIADMEWPNGRKLPDGVRILIRDNPASKKDATYEYLLRIAKEFGPERVLLYSPEWAGEHGHNLDFLLTKSTAEWALAIDSDIEFLTSDWHTQLMSFIDEHEAMECAVEIATSNKPDDVAMLPGAPSVPRRWVPRSTSYFMLFKPEFARKERISFGRNDYDVRTVFGDVFPYPTPGFMPDDGRQRWSCDHGWQLLWAGANRNEDRPFTLVQISPKIAKTYVHHFHKICGFMLSAGEKPNSPTNRAFWGQDIPQLIP